VLIGPSPGLLGLDAHIIRRIVQPWLSLVGVVARLDDGRPGGANDDKRHTALLEHMVDVGGEDISRRNIVDIHEDGIRAKACLEPVIDMAHAILGIGALPLAIQLWRSAALPV